MYVYMIVISDPGDICEQTADEGSPRSHRHRKTGETVNWCLSEHDFGQTGWGKQCRP